MRVLFLCLFVICSAKANAQAGLVSFQSSAQQTSLIELYTSEGCSSCPPAETWLGQLQGSPGLWKDFVPLAFHVDYWDYLGWRDPWAKGQFSDRQRAYAKQWQSDSIYTPAFVLNGKEWRDWRGQQGALKLSTAKAGLLTVSSSDKNHWRVNFAPLNAGAASYEAYAARLASGLNSDVRAGENRGRRLNHAFVVMALVKASLVRSGGVVQGDFILPRQPDTAGRSLALAVWITPTGRLEPLQATGGWLSRPALGR